MDKNQCDECSYKILCEIKKYKPIGLTKGQECHWYNKSIHDLIEKDIFDKWKKTQKNIGT